MTTYILGFFDTLSFHPGEAILQTGVNIGRNGLNVLLDGFVAVFQGYLHLADGIEHRGMVLGKLLADVWQA